MQVFNLFMPRVNIRRQAQWYADGEPQDFSPSDSQVRLRHQPPGQSRMLLPCLLSCLANRQRKAHGHSRAAQEIEPSSMILCY